MIPDINKAWSILMKGQPVPEKDWGRRVNATVYTYYDDIEPIIDTLVPYGDQLLRYSRIEDLVQLVLVSDLRSRFLGVDSINTYEKSVLQFPVPGERAYPLPTGVQALFYTDKNTYERNGQGIHRFEAAVSGNTLTTPYGIEPFTVQNNLSSLIEIFPGMSLRLQGPVSGASFDLNMELVARPTTDWAVLLNSLSRIDLRWTSDGALRETWLEDPNWVNRIAAVVQSILELSLSWRPYDNSELTS